MRSYFKPHLIVDRKLIQQLQQRNVQNLINSDIYRVFWTDLKQLGNVQKGKGHSFYAENGRKALQSGSYVLGKP